MLRIGLGQYRTVLDVGRKPLQTGGGTKRRNWPPSECLYKTKRLATAIWRTYLQWGDIANFFAARRYA